MLHNSLSRATKEDMLQPCAPVRWHNDEIGRNCLRQPANFIERRRATEHIAGRGNVTSHSLATFLSSFSAVCSAFCSYVMKENGTIGGAGATKSVA